jgi:diketogulonate reductase-like aldo/keto reductase
MADFTITSTRTLNDGNRIPVFGFGTCASEACTPSALAALKNGYIHIDTAQIYRNEAETGRAIAESQIPHSKIFVCSKLWEDEYGRAEALDGVKKSLGKLGLDEIDLYLLHTPRPGQVARTESWLGLQDAVSQGLVRTIGVSNWAPKHFEMLMKEEGVTTFPAVNQIEFHPWQQQKEIVKYCREKGIVVVAYSPLTQGKRLGDPTIGKLAKKYGKTPAQVVLRWCLQKDIVIIPKSDKEHRIIENKGIFDWRLEKEDEEVIDGLDEGQKANIGEWDPFAWD